jgi:hypothetical protein
MKNKKSRNGFPIRIEAGEDISPGDFVYIESDGKAYKTGPQVAEAKGIWGIDFTQPEKEIIDLEQASDGVWRPIKEECTPPDFLDEESLEQIRRVIREHNEMIEKMVFGAFGNTEK